MHSIHTYTVRFSQLNNDSLWPFLTSLEAFFGRIYSSDKPPEASRLCGHEIGLGLFMQVELCKRV